jgi:hypothetical protein
MSNPFRKTVSIKALVDSTNTYLAYAPPRGCPGPTREMRLGAAVALENALFLAGAYRGFRYLDPIHWRDDDSRRAYILHPKLRA